jgi:hypothetical protein
VLPLISARSDRRAAIGVFLSIMSMALYRESQPFIRQSTNLIVYVAQYAILATFGAALAIDVQLNNGLNPLAFGSVLCAVNFTVILLAFWLSGARYYREMKMFRASRDRSANGKIEVGIGFSEDKFATTLDSIDINFVSPSQCVVFYYTTLSAANKALKQGIPAVARKGEQDGILFTLHRPYELDAVDRAVFRSFEAVLACSIPLLYLTTVQGSEYLRLVEASVLQALRSNFFGDIADPTPWFNKGVLLPPKQIVRAFQIAEDTSSIGVTAKEPDMMKDTVYERNLLPRRTSADIDVSGRTYRFRMRSKDSGSFLSKSEASMDSSVRGSTDSLSTSLHGVSSGTSSFRQKSVDKPRELTWETFLRVPNTCTEFCADMSIIRLRCSEKGWHPVFHYTQPFLGPMIFKSGFRMSTQGQGDGGVYFSTLGPASYEVGADEYETNIIVDCYGESRLEEYRDQHKLDLVFVYGVEPDILSQAPGGRTNAKMVSKAVFEALTLAHADGNYFLRPDRIMGAFLIDPSDPPAFTTDAMEPLVVERNLDSQSRDELSAAQTVMEKNAENTRHLLRLRPKSHHHHHNDRGQSHPRRGNTPPRAKSPFAARPPAPSGAIAATKGMKRGSETRGDRRRTSESKGTSDETEEFKNNGVVSSGIELKDRIPFSKTPSTSSRETTSNKTLEDTMVATITEADAEHERRKSDHLIKSSASFKPKHVTAATTNSTNNKASKSSSTTKPPSTSKRNSPGRASPARGTSKMKSADFTDGFAGDPSAPNEQSMDKSPPTDDDATYI